MKRPWSPQHPCRLGHTSVTVGPARCAWSADGSTHEINRRSGSVLCCSRGRPAKRVDGEAGAEPKRLRWGAGGGASMWLGCLRVRGGGGGRDVMSHRPNGDHGLGYTFRVLKMQSPPFHQQSPRKHLCNGNIFEKEINFIDKFYKLSAVCNKQNKLNATSTVIYLNSAHNVLLITTKRIHQCTHL